ncbi:thymidine phosphorylase [Wenzhouxiangella marina]|uniref:thymidine phosphorylase n=1 Tax=Wenzhouxiangella marina TaxID=1579979 RepID=UPI0006734614|nr:thymidine phosphorylase [Wenzhouxiangella marina]MBB6086899.1 thymidine phosphorylase [Wenzhouxiangella marina]
MLARELLLAKRHGQTLERVAIDFLVEGMADGRLGDEQLGAFAMAVAIQGMDRTETVALTEAMRDSGRVMQWPGLDGPVLDKHSTGGIGDSTSFLIGPWLACCGAYVPMITGRGLGHTGGTCDKLESIPGYDTAPDPDRLDRIVRELGVAIIGQTSDLAPADRRLYAVRDVTGTVDCLPLIVASILSKKLAEGLDGLVLDVKFGSGAVMTDFEPARELAIALARTASAAGTPTRALLTDMNQGLGRTAGNALEIREIIELLNTPSPTGRLFELSRELSAELLLIGGLDADPAEARDRLDRAWASGAVAERFARMVHALGGPSDLMERPDQHLARAPVEVDLYPSESGRIESIDVRALGLAVIELGGGRRQASDAIDPAVGLSGLARIGDEVDAQRPLLRIHARKESEAERVGEALRRAYRISAAGAEAPALIAERIEV